MDRYAKSFLITLTLLIILGIIMVYSSSYIYAKEVVGDSQHFFLKQLMMIFLSLPLAFLLSKTKLSFWYKNIYFFNALMVCFLVLTFTPLGTEVKGSHRWLNFFGLGFQPGEFIKYTLMLSSLKFFNQFEEYTREQRVLYFSGILIPLICFVFQPDFGTFSISIALILFCCFISEFPRRYFYGLMILSLITVAGVLFMAPYRVRRLMTYLNPWEDPQNSGFQIIQSYLAFANGHIFGMGIGNSNVKLFYLPEAYNDFIFSVIGEELGLIGVFIFVVLFMLLSYLGFKIALNIKCKVNAMVVASISFAIAIQAFLNMGVVLGLLPTKGLNLPFISYGGSSMLANLALIGLLFSAQKAKSAIESLPSEGDNDSDNRSLFEHPRQHQHTAYWQ